MVLETRMIEQRIIEDALIESCNSETDNITISLPIDMSRECPASETIKFVPITSLSHYY